MRVVLALLVAVPVVAVPAPADEPAPYVRTCSSSAFGDLGRGWQGRAVVAGPLAFVGAKDGLASSRYPQKILIVVEPRRVATVTIATRSSAHAALGYNDLRPTGVRVPLTSGTRSVRFEACGAVVPGSPRLPWNRGTQFPGYFLVNGPRCVHVEIRAGGTLIRRALPFGAARCG